ncbi:elongation factor Tu-like [Brevipalpus obovatus]|uniref:elongation factor Tu-like n=1 Tax=Brevipalpus obovatus TaxID=246614 RepID=UPI003D9DE4DC
MIRHCVHCVRSSTSCSEILSSFRIILCNNLAGKNVSTDFKRSWRKFSFRYFASSSSSADNLPPKPHANVCLLGDHQHGKTTLASAITLIQSQRNQAVFKEVFEIDNSREEIAKKCSINPSKMKFETNRRTYVLIDPPGHQDYLKNTVTGSSGSDYGIIVVAGDEGPTNGTRTHLLVAKHLRIKNLAAFISKVDKTDGESVDIVEMATKEMLEEEGFNPDGIKFFYGSPNLVLDEPENQEKQACIVNLLENIDNLSEIGRNISSKGMMYIEKIYAPPSRATGVTGIIERGQFTRGDKVELVGFDKCIRTTICGIESFGQVKDKAIAGESVEILLKGVKRSDVPSGMIVTPVDHQLNGQDNIEVLVKMIPAHGDDRYVLFNGDQKHFIYRTGELFGSLSLEGKEFIVSGDSSLMRLRIQREYFFQEGQSLLFRDGRRVFALGEITKILPNMSGNERKNFLRPKTRSEKELFSERKKRVRSDLGIRDFL